MNKSERFSAVHKEAKATRNNFNSYRDAFSSALKASYAVVEIPTEFQKAIEAINNGGKFNGTVYTKASGKHFMTLSVYVNNQYFSLGCVGKEYAQEEKESFLSFVKASKPETTVNSGYGFAMKDTRRNWDNVSKYGYDAIEM